MNLKNKQMKPTSDMVDRTGKLNAQPNQEVHTADSCCSREPWPCSGVLSKMGGSNPAAGRQGKKENKNLKIDINY